MISTSLGLPLKTVATCSEFSILLKWTSRETDSAVGCAEVYTDIDRICLILRTHVGEYRSLTDQKK